MRCDTVVPCLVQLFEFEFSIEILFIYYSNVSLFVISVVVVVVVILDKEVALGHHPSNKLTAGKNGDKAPLVSWEPYFCVLLQDEQTFTAYRSEEMAVS